ncbi:CYTH-like domain-containing protein, partial [Clohesyomyces aquaticus]
LPRQPRVLAVERKFIPTSESIARLRSNIGQPRFRHIRELGVSHSHEIYYDRDNALNSQGIYVRLRNGKWEAKVRTSGDYTNSRFEEYDDLEEIRRVVRKALEPTGGFVDTWQMGLSPWAEFKTKRETWDVRSTTALSAFRVVIDQTDFGHAIGEVKLCESLHGHVDQPLPVGELKSEQTGLDLDHKIEAFMRAYKWAFPNVNGEGMGKLSAYF